MYGLRYPPRLAWMSDRSRCADRFKAVGEQIRNANPPYDIVAIQEFYRVRDLHIVTCDPSPFLDSLVGDRESPHKFQHILFSPRGQGWRLEADGGMGLITPHPIEASEALRFVGSGGTFLAARGVIYARVALPQSHFKVDVYVVHLSPGRQNSEQRRSELEALSRMIKSRSAVGGNPVVVLGDFNIEGIDEGAEYRTIRRVLGNPRDLWLEAGPPDPGYTYECSQNAVAALRGCDYRVRIDYIWIVSSPGVINNPELKVSAEDMRKVEWHTAGPDPLPVSDHYGVEVSLSLERENHLPPPILDPEKRRTAPGARPHVRLNSSLR